MIKDKINVVGSGTAGLMFATYFKKMIPDIEVNLYFDKNIKPLLVGESSQPYISKYFDTIFDSDEEWMNSCNSTYKFYVKHDNWNHNGHSWTFPLCDERSDSVDFNNLSLSECESELLNYSKHNVAPRQRTAWHMQSSKLQPLLLEKCVELGVNIISESYKFDKLKDNEYTIDCRGFHGQDSIKQVSPAIINDYAIAGHIPFDQERYYTQTIAHEVGWNWEIPLQNLLGVGRVFSTKYLSIDEAKHQMNKWYGLTDFYEVPFRSRYNDTPCTPNSLKIGSAAVFIEPLESTTLMLVTFMVESFVELLKSFDYHINRDSCYYYNRGYREMVNSQVSYIEGFYCISERRNSDYWKEVTSNYNWYMNKLEKNGWPEYFGKYGFQKFFGGFNKEKEFEHIKLRIHNEHC